MNHFSLQTSIPWIFPKCFRTRGVPLRVGAFTLQRFEFRREPLAAEARARDAMPWGLGCCGNLLWKDVAFPSSSATCALLIFADASELRVWLMLVSLVSRTFFWRNAPCLWVHSGVFPTEIRPNWAVPKVFQIIGKEPEWITYDRPSTAGFSTHPSCHPSKRIR